MSARDEVISQISMWSVHGPHLGPDDAGEIYDSVVDAITAAGYRIIGPGELDRETLERAAGIDPKRFSSEDVAIEVLASIRALTGKAGEA